MTKNEFIAFVQSRRSTTPLPNPEYHVCDGRNALCPRCQLQLKIEQQDPKTAMGATSRDLDYAIPKRS